MAKQNRRRVPKRAALPIGPFVFDRTIPSERACAEYIAAAPQGYRFARIRQLVLLGHGEIRKRHSSTPDHEV